MHFLNLGHTVETTARLVRSLTGTYPELDTIDESYRTAISAIRYLPPPAEGIFISFEDGEWGRYLTRNNIFPSLFVGVQDTYADTRRTWTALAREAIAYVSELNADLGRIVNLLVTDIVIFDTDRTGGGSGSNIPGLVAISPGPNWTMVDWAESLVHETTHLNLFVADMVYALYELPTSELGEDRYRVLSAVKIGEFRPLDKAFHAAAVTVPLMWMQHQRGETTLVDLFTSSLLESTDGLLDKLDVFTSYGQMLVKELRTFAENTNFAYVERSFSEPRYSLYKPAAA